MIIPFSKDFEIQIPKGEIPSHTNFNEYESDKKIIKNAVKGQNEKTPIILYNGKQKLKFSSKKTKNEP